MQRTNKKVASHGLWMVTILGVGIVCAFLVTEAIARASTVFEKVNYERVEIDTEDTSQLQPEKTYYIVGEAPLPSLDADGYLVADLNTGQILLAQASKVVYPIASITKLMTAIIAEDQFREDELITVSKDAIDTEGYRGGLSVGQKIPLHELLYPLFLVSSNDAGEAIARHENRTLFIDAMNDRAQKLGMENTHFADPTGLSPDNIGTAEDLFVLLQYLYKEQPGILEITNAEYYSKGPQVWENKNKLLNEATFVGGKTGFTNPAKRTGAGVYEIPLSGGDTQTIGIVILHSDDREGDIRAIINYLQKYIHYGTETSLASLNAQ